MLLQAFQFQLKDCSLFYLIVNSFNLYNVPTTQSSETLPFNVKCCSPPPAVSGSLLKAMEN